MTTVCIIQARMGSERLPGKVLQLIEDTPMIEWVVRRALHSHLLDRIIIATTDLPQDDALATLCAMRGWNSFRGSETDVLDRYYQAARQVNASTIVRVTSDCPLIDPFVLDYVIAAYRSSTPAVDYASNVIMRTYPRGLDVEVFSFEALERSWKEDRGSGWREHVTPYINQQPDRFRLLHVINPVDFSQYRLTVDTPPDLELIRRIYRHFGSSSFGWRDVIQLLVDNPDWADINREVAQKPISR